MTNSATPFPAPEPVDAGCTVEDDTFRPGTGSHRSSPSGVSSEAEMCVSPAAMVAPHSYSRTAQSGTSAWNPGGAAGDARCRDEPPPFRDTPDHVVCVDDPAELIAGVPAMLGFTPERSVVVLVLRHGTAGGAIVDAVVRFDLDSPSGRRVRGATLAAAVARICAHDEAAEVLAVVVDERAVEPGAGADRPGCATGRFDVLVGSLGRRLAACDISLGGVWAVRAIAAGQRWWTLAGPQRHGVLRDPAASLVTLTHVLDGRPIRGSRSELTALVARDPLAHAEVAAHLPDALARARERYARAARRGDPIGYSRQALDHVLWQIANTASGAALMAPELARIAAALRDKAVRDSMFALAVGDNADAAEAVWAALTRALSGADRAEAAALLGYSAYVRGDGPLAGIALEAALEADPGHPMAMLLDTSLRLGMRPEQLRRLAHSGYRTAAGLGVDLGAPTS
ncbi:DUF4192 domain-containing protein [Nocardia sp. NPDC047648]|uniref:DUF4192 domain-containing protein n=1 Tax=Nocardia sp. NPDC047648 TaxID=3155625 RepID=UPI0033D3D41F